LTFEKEDLNEQEDEDNQTISRSGRSFNISEIFLFIEQGKAFSLLWLHCSK